MRRFVEFLAPHKLMVCLLVPLVGALGCKSLSQQSSTSAVSSGQRGLLTELLDSLLQLQHPTGEWVGVVESDPTTDIFHLLLARALLRQHLISPAQFGEIREQTIQASFKSSFFDGRMWRLYPDGPVSPRISETILRGLEIGGIARSDKRVRNLWQNVRLMGPSHLGIMQKIIFKIAGDPQHKNESLLLPWPKTLMAGSPLPINVKNIGIVRAALIPLIIWKFYDDRVSAGTSVARLSHFHLASRGSLIGDNSIVFLTQNDEFWVQEALGWLIDHQQADGTWAGAYHLTYISTLAMLKAHEAGVYDFSRQIARAWQGLGKWRRELDSGVVIQQIIESPVFDSARVLAALTEVAKLKETSSQKIGMAASKAQTFLLDQQILTKGDWIYSAPNAKPGGWAFLYHNSFYPDVDDTAMVLDALSRSLALTSANADRTTDAIKRGLSWMLHLQNADGGFPAWDKNTSSLLRTIVGIKSLNLPQVSDHSTADVTGRVLGAFHSIAAHTQITVPQDALNKACAFLWGERDDGFQLWSGMWAVNYAYGTAEALEGLILGRCLDLKKLEPYAAWLARVQNKDGGWGEDPKSYDTKTFVDAPSSIDLTAWILRSLITYENARRNDRYRVLSVGQVIERGVQFLEKKIRTQGSPYEHRFNGVAAPKEQYCRYSMVGHYETIRSLAAYEALRREDETN